MPRNLVDRRLPYQLGFRPATGSTPFTDPKGTYDVSIGGIPFLVAAGNRSSAYSVDRYIRRTAQFQREQFDSSREPGEQTLTGWWLRSQSSFHLGAGQQFENETDEANPFRFDESEGIDVWTPGHVKLLPTTTLRKAGGASVLAQGATDGTTDIILYANGAVLTRLTDAAEAAVTWGGSGTILSLTDNGSKYFAADSTGIYSGTLAGGAGTLAWNTGSANVTIGWVKQRLMAGIGPSIYELAGGSPPTLPTPTYTHPNPSWRWTSIAEGPDAIYVAGYAGARSAVIKLALDTTGALPTLTQASTAAELPTGELVRSIYGYLGSFLAIGTTKGVRIASVSDAGVVTYGPLIESPGAVNAFVGSDRFVYAGWSNAMTDGTSGLIRVDLSQQLSDGRYAYATDLRAHVPGNVTSVTLRGASGVVCFAVSGQGLYEQASTLEAQGYLRTYRIRYSTLWPKLYRRLSLRCSPPFMGTIGISTIDETDTEASLATITPDFDSRRDINVGYPVRPQTYLALRLTLHSTLGGSASPDLSGYQLKAVPGGPRPREYVIPLYAFDYEKDRNGVDVGYDGWGILRLRALEELDSAGDTVLLQNLLTDEAEVILIDSIEFVQNSPPATTGESWGGVVTVTCRGVTE